MRLFLLPLLLWAVLDSSAGPIESALSLADAEKGSAQVAAAHKAARKGARLPGKIVRWQRVRAASWISVGRLGVYDADIHDAARRALLTEHNVPAVRANTAWALGESGRSLPWAQSRPISDLLEEAMRGQLDPHTSYHVVEAFGKVYTPHDHSFEENLAAARALNTLSANQQKTQLPPIYYVVLDRVLTFDVAIKLLRDVVAEARKNRSEQSLAEAYAGMLTTVRWLASRQEQLIAGYADQQKAIASAFDALLEGLDLEDRRLTLMLTWALGNVDDPAFAELVGERMGRQVKVKDPTIRMMTAFSLYRLRSSLPAREALRGTYLSTEADARVFEMLAHLRSDPSEMDAVQKLYKVEPKK